MHINRHSSISSRNRIFYLPEGVTGALSTNLPDYRSLIHIHFFENKTLIVKKTQSNQYVIHKITYR